MKFSPPLSLSTVKNVWLGMEKNQEAVIYGQDNHADAEAEKYLVYVDGTTYKAFGGVKYSMTRSTMCVASDITDGTRWRDSGCTIKREVLCEFNCDNVND